MLYRIVAVFATVASAGLLSVTLWHGAVAETIVMLVTLGILLNVALIYNSLIGTLTNGQPSQLVVEWLLRDTM
jgi:hypothetical protein